MPYNSKLFPASKSVDTSKFSCRFVSTRHKEDAQIKADAFLRQPPRRRKSVAFSPFFCLLSLLCAPFQSPQAPTFWSSKAECSSPHHFSVSCQGLLCFALSFFSVMDWVVWNQVRWLMLFYWFWYLKNWVFVYEWWCWKVSGCWRWDFCALSLIGSVDSHRRKLGAAAPLLFELLLSHFSTCQFFFSWLLWLYSDEKLKSLSL